MKTSAEEICEGKREDSARMLRDGEPLSGRSRVRAGAKNKLAGPGLQRHSS